MSNLAQLLADAREANAKQRDLLDEIERQLSGGKQPQSYMPTWVSMKEAARRLGINVKTIYRNPERYGVQKFGGGHPRINASRLPPRRST